VDPLVLIELGPPSKKGVILILEADQVRHLAPSDMNAAPSPLRLCPRPDVGGCLAVDASPHCRRNPNSRDARVDDRR
jgi:hypothetical protein